MESHRWDAHTLHQLYCCGVAVGPAGVWLYVARLTSYPPAGMKVNRHERHERQTCHLSLVCLGAGDNKIHFQQLQEIGNKFNFLLNSKETNTSLQQLTSTLVITSTGSVSTQLFPTLIVDNNKNFWCPHEPLSKLFSGGTDCEIKKGSSPSRASYEWIPGVRLRYSNSHTRNPFAGF